MPKIKPLETILIDIQEQFLFKFPLQLSWAPSADASPILIRFTKPERADMRAGSKLAKEGYAADLAWKGYPLVTAVERKASGRELYNNHCGPQKERSRYLRALDRLAKVRFPFLYLDMSWDEMYAAPGDSDIDMAIVHQLLAKECMIRNISIIGPAPAGSTALRLKAGTFILGLMASAIFGEPSRVPHFTQTTQAIFSEISTDSPCNTPILVA